MIQQNKRTSLFFLRVLLVSSALFALSGSVAAQGNLYLWQHAIAVGTAEQDSAWTGSTEWYDVTIYADTVDTWLTFGAPDTTSWSSRDAILLKAGTSIYIGPSTRLRRMLFSTVSGSGVFYLVGRKKRAQY